MTSRIRLLLLVALTGCATRAAPRAPRYCVDQDRAVTSTPRGVQESVPQTIATESSDDAAPEREEPPCISPRARIEALQGEVAQGLAAVVAPAADCRTACRAATGVCAAAEEICRLTGDAGAEDPRDARCAQARSSCADARRQRGERCPVCPVE